MAPGEQKPKPTRASGPLVVTHSGTSYAISTGDVGTFGRGVDSTIRIGAHDLHVHRRAGSFRWLGGYWQLRNDGDKSTLEVLIEGGLEARIAVGAHPMILPGDASGTIRLLTPTPYELAFLTPLSAQIIEVAEPEDTSGDLTVEPRIGLGLTDPEIVMLVALCEPRLRNPQLPAFTIPSTKDICERLKVTPKRVEDVVDSLVTKLAHHVDGVIGSNDGRAVNRRHRIAAFAIDTRCVTQRDLRLLDRRD